MADFHEYEKMKANFKEQRQQSGQKSGAGKGDRKKQANGHDDDPSPEIGFGDELDTEEFPKMDWIIEGIVPTGLGVLAGKPKIGKSWIAYDLALACARGALALTKIATKRCEVLYLALEDPKRRVQARMRKILAGEPGPHDFKFAITWPTGMSALEYLDSYLEQHPACRFVLIDPFAKVRGSGDGHKNAYAQDYEDMAGYHALANRRNVCILLIFHTRKQDASDVMDRISGTTAIQGAADFMMVLTRDRGQFLGQLAITGRDIVDGGEFAVSFDKETCKWKILGEAQVVQRESDQDRIYQYLVAQKEPVRLTEIVHELDIKRYTVSKTLNRLARKGSVEHVGRDAWRVRNAG